MEENQALRSSVVLARRLLVIPVTTVCDEDHIPIVITVSGKSAHQHMRPTSSQGRLSQSIERSQQQACAPARAACVTQASYVSAGTSLEGLIK
jgi:hypothetical protein